jgi:penicillin amidase
MSIEAGEETIVPSDEPAGIGGHDSVEGSNNWVVGGGRSASGAPVLATDPHNAIAHPSQWFEAQLTTPDTDAVGAFYLGTPSLYLGHTRRTAWGVTNHTASARDLFRETVSQDNPELYLEEGEWRTFDVESEVIAVSGREDETLQIRRTVRGPVMNAFVPTLGDRQDPPLSLAWMGSEPTTGFDALLGLIRSQSLDDVVAALEQWPFPILNMVFADADGRIGYRTVGRVPVRKAPWHGYRPAGDPDHVWRGVYTFDELPHETDPDRDWVATANNPPWGGKGPYLSLGSWADGYRFRRIRDQIEATEAHSLETVGAIQADSVHGRAEELGPLVAALAQKARAKAVREMGDLLAGWDGDFSADEIAPTVFVAFWEMWLRRVAAARFPYEVVDQVASRAGAVANGLLTGKVTGWLTEGTTVEREVAEAMQEAITWLKLALGPRKAQWRWGRVHTVTFPHPISRNAATGKTFDVGPFESSGGNGTVRAAGFSTSLPFRVTGVSTYRMVVDMADPAHGKSTTTGGQSGHPASPHYADQAKLWAEDGYHPLLMDEKDVRENLEGELELVPGSMASSD